MTKEEFKSMLKENLTVKTGIYNIAFNEGDLITEIYFDNELICSSKKTVRLG